ncbi:MAG: hypothetical protein LUQ65_10260 [Candidatus Helarchaeota archaeon]|nr:hypothetical protein [Candidatus Helarchaeota archaeon]
MAIFRVNNATVLGNFVCAPWVPNTAYALGDRVVCRPAYATTARRAWVYECTTAGTSGAAEPAWPASGTVAEGPDTLVWTTRNPNDGVWANASCILHYILNHAATVAGDFVYIHEAHNEQTNLAAQYIINSPGILSNPIKIICVDKADDSLSTGAIVENLYTGTAAMSFRGYGYSYGVNYVCDADHIYINNATYNTFWIFEGNGTDVLTIQASGKSIIFGTGSTYSDSLKIINGNINFAYANNYISLYYGYMFFEWEGGSIIAPNGVTKLFSNTGTSTLNVSIRDVDLSQMSSGVISSQIVDASEFRLFNINIERCKFPSTEGFIPFAGDIPANANSMFNRFRCHHCSSANRTYDFFEKDYFGEVEDETVIVRSGGASDGTTPQSWRMSTHGNPLDGYLPFKSPPIVTWCPYAVSKTFTIEGVYDSATNIQDDEIWMELECPANNTDGLGIVGTDKCANLGAAADKSASSEVWPVTGIWPGVYISSWAITLNSFQAVAAQYNFRNVITAAMLSTSGSQIRLRLTGHNTLENHISGVSIGLRSGTSEDFNGAPTRVTFNGGSNTVTLPALASIYSDWITFSLDETLAYLVHIACVVDIANYGRVTTGAGGMYYKATADDDTMVEDISGYSSAANYCGILSEIEVAPAAGAGNAFKCQVTTTPGKVGPITARVCLAKPNTTVYIDPLITVS